MWGRSPTSFFCIWIYPFAQIQLVEKTVLPQLHYISSPVNSIGNWSITHHYWIYSHFCLPGSDLTPACCKRSWASSVLWIPYYTWIITSFFYVYGDHLNPYCDWKKAITSFAVTTEANLTLTGKLGHRACSELAVCVPENSHAGVLMPNVIVRGEGAFGGNEVWWGSPCDGICALIRRGAESLPPLSLPRLCRDTQPFANQREGSHQTPTLPVPWSWTSQPSESWETNISLFKPHSLKQFVIAAWTE